MPDFGMDRMAAMDRMSGRDMGSTVKSMMAAGAPPPAAGGGKDLVAKVEALAGNPEFARELEGLIAKYEGGSPAPPAPEV